MKDFMKKLLYFMKDYKKESVLAPLFKMLEAFFELFVPLVVASIIDDGIVPKDSGHIIRMCLLSSGVSSSGIGHVLLPHSILRQSLLLERQQGFVMNYLPIFRH